MKRGWIWIAVLAVAGGGLWYGLAHRAGGAGAEKYKTETVERGDVAMTVTATGTISAVTTVQVGSQVSGIISKLHADFNTPVRKGELVAELDPTPFQATVEQRQADVQQAEVKQRNTKVTFERQKNLLAENLVAESDYDAAKADFESAQAAVDQAKAALTQAKTNLTYTQIASPIDGVVIDRQYDVGQTVAASFQAPTLFSIAQDLTKMQVQADVDQSDIGRIQLGQQARFTVDAYPDEAFTGQITQIRLNATVSQNVVTYPVIIEVPNPDLKLRPKMTADVSVEVARVHDTLRVPNAALRFRPTDVAATKETKTAASGAAPTGAPGAGAAASGAAPSTRGGGATTRGPGGGGRSSGGSGFAGAAQTLGDASKHGDARTAEKNWQTIYRIDAKGALEAVKVRTGITDGKSTQILEGDLKPGDRIVVGLATAKAGETGQQPLAGGGRRF